jgi:hypothetical protein
MDIPIRDVTQVSLDQILAYQQALQKEIAGTLANQPGLVADDASVIQKAGELAREILLTETPPQSVLDWDELDSPENAYQAAKSLLKYGV